MKKLSEKLRLFFVAFLCICVVFATNIYGENSNNTAKTKNLKVATDSNIQPYSVDDHTKLLMYMNDNTFKDECGHTVTNNGATLSSEQYKFNNSSCYFNGSSNMLVSSTNSDLEIKKYNAVTIDFWVYIVSGYSNHITSILDSNNCSYLNSTGWNMGYDISRNILFYTQDNDDFCMCGKIPTTTTLLNTWHHVALVKDGTTMTLYLDGKSIINKSGYFSYNGSSTGIDIGGAHIDNLGYYSNLYIQNLRISDCARWTSDFTPQNINAAGITLNKTTDNLTVGQTDTLTATVTPDTATNKAVTWKSSDDSIATVDSNGKITAVKAGTATITATTTDGSNLSATCDVTVTEATTPTTGNATLIISMNNGQIKSYSVDMTKINDFISWYNNRASGTSQNAYYTFDKTDSNNPDIKKTEYIVYDKISSYEVDQSK